MKKLDQQCTVNWASRKTSQYSHLSTKMASLAGKKAERAGLVSWADWTSRYGQMCWQDKLRIYDIWMFDILPNDKKKVMSL